MNSTMLKKLGVIDKLLSKYEGAAIETFDSNFVSKKIVLKNAREANLCKENIKLVSDFMDYADEDIKKFIWLFYYIQFKSEENFIENIWVLDDIQMPENIEAIFPGCIKAVTYLLAAENFRQWLEEHKLPLDMMEGYYDRYRSFVMLNIMSHNTYGLCRLSPFLYGYAKPFMLGIGRLTFQLIPFKDYAQMYENKDGERLFVAMPNYAYDDKGFQDTEGIFIPKYEKKDDKLHAHVFNKNGALSREYQEIDLKEWKLVYSPGDYMVTVHIPEGRGKLTKEAVKETFKEADKILRKNFPRFNTYVCQTWFLDPALRGEIIKDGSNMADFADIFDIICGPDNNNHSLFEHVFKTTRKPLEELKPANGFQERILERAKRGEKIYWSFGVLKNDYKFE